MSEGWDQFWAAKDEICELKAELAALREGLRELINTDGGLAYGPRRTAYMIKKLLQEGGNVGKKITAIKDDGTFETAEDN